VSVLVVGSINQDYIVTVARRPAAGETVSGADFTTAAGGKGGNQAAAAARLGGDVRLLARLGADVEGHRMRALLEDSGVDVSVVRAVHGARTGAAFVTVTPDGENTIVVAPGANLALSAVDVDGAVHLISAASVLVLQLEVPVETVTRAAELAPADTRVLLNLAPAADVPPLLLERADPLVVNLSEAAFLLDRSIDGVSSARTAANDLLRLGPRSVILTLGPDGALLATGGPVEHVSAPEVTVVDSTGAGDAFVGAVAVRLAEGADLREAVRLGVRAGAGAAASAGARAVPAREDLP